MKNTFLYCLLASFLLLALPAQADLNYVPQPLYLASGVKPNVALLVDNSTSMTATDTGGSGALTSTCNGSSLTQPLTRLNAAKQAACQMVQDHSAFMRIGLFTFTGGSALDTTSTGIQLQAFDSTVPNLKTSIQGLVANQYTPLGGAMNVMANAYMGSGSPIQYQCQKNYVVLLTDGDASSGIDYASSSFTLPFLNTVQESRWPNSTAATGATVGSPNWDGYPDPLYVGASGRSVYPWLDDLSQLLYDVDIKTANSTTSAGVCGGVAPPQGYDCAGDSWNGIQQNVVTYAVGLGPEANNSLLRNTPLVETRYIVPEFVDVANDIIALQQHGLSSGDYVHYYAAYENYSYTKQVTGNTSTDTLSGDTTNMQAGDMLTYHKNSGASLQYRLITTPAVPAASCGAIGGLTSGSTYYVAQRSATEFRLSPTSANAYLSSALADLDSVVSSNATNLTSAGTANTVHAFSRSHASAGFISTGTGTTPVDNTVNVEKIIRSNHGLNTGDPVIYTCTGTSCAIGGLTSGSTYYVARRSADEFRLSTSASLAAFCAESADGVVGFGCIDLTSRGGGGAYQMFSKTATATATSFSATGSGTTPVNTAANVEKITATSAHGFNTGDRVTYTCNNFAGTPAVYTSYDVPTTLYAKNVVAGNPGTFQLALTAGGATLDLSHAGNPAQTVFWERTIYQSMIGGLYAYETDATPDATPNPATESAARGKYYVEVVDENSIKLHPCGNVAGCTSGAANAADLTSVGSGLLSGGPGKAHFVLTTENLLLAMEEVFTRIREGNAYNNLDIFASAETTNSAELNGATRFYQSQFSPANWRGELVSLLSADGVVVSEIPEWQASEKLPVPVARNILTRNNNSGAFGFITGNWSQFTATQQAALSNAGSAVVGQEVLNWLRGEEAAGYRMRTDSKLGDMLNSSPVFVGQPNQNYGSALPDSDPGKSSYNLFKAVARIPMIYVGANDGMLHGFDAGMNPSTQGVETFAFIPESVYMDWDDLDNDGIKDAGETAINKFYELSQEGYGQLGAPSHHYFVDGSPTVGDAYFGGSWHTVLVGGLGKGGRSVYALDITDNNFTAADVLWEFNDSNSGDMGYSYSKPAIARLSNGQWVAIFGNGYDSRNDQARLYIVNLETGALIEEITLGIPGNNGLSSVSVLRSNTAADGVTALVVYAGDLQGNVWKVDISVSIPTSVITPFFVAQDNSSNRQPITSEITLQRYDSLDALDDTAPEAGLMLLFGTGSYFRQEDRGYQYPASGPIYQAMYGIWDKGDATHVDLADLVEQSRGTALINGMYRPVATANAINYASMDRGWYMKLAVANNFLGERVLRAPLTRGSYVIFDAVTHPSDSPCASANIAERYVLDALTGGASAYSPFDLDYDGSVEDEDPSVIGQGFSYPMYRSMILEDSNDAFSGNHVLCTGSLGIGMTCDSLFIDSDGDGYLDDIDVFPYDPSEWVDTDYDGVGDNSDAFPLDFYEWADADGDAVGDNSDAFPLDPAEWLDTDGDSIGNNADWDDDNDGVPDTIDAAPLDAGDASEIILPLDGNYKGKVLESQQSAQ